MKVRKPAIAVIILLTLLLFQQNSLGQTNTPRTKIYIDLSNQQNNVESHAYTGNQVEFGVQHPLYQNRQSIRIAGLDHTYAHITYPTTGRLPILEMEIYYEYGNGFLNDAGISFGPAIGMYWDQNNWFSWSIGNLDRTTRNMLFHGMLDGVYMGDLSVYGPINNFIGNEIRIRVDLSIIQQITLQYSIDNGSTWTVWRPTIGQIDPNTSIFPTAFNEAGLAMFGKGVANVPNGEQIYLGNDFDSFVSTAKDWGEFFITDISIETQNNTSAEVTTVTETVTEVTIGTETVTETEATTVTETVTEATGATTETITETEATLVTETVTSTVTERTIEVSTETITETVTEDTNGTINPSSAALPVPYPSPILFIVTVFMISILIRKKNRNN